MMRFLLFTYYAPLAAMGDIAPGERRMGFARPARSAILGLVAAALGLARDDPGQPLLEGSFLYAVRTDVVGRPFVDYHTAQTPQQRKGQSYPTRRAELQAESLNTVLSTREWRSDALYTIALWERAGAAVTLDSVKVALGRPRFTLYAGRKAGPLGLPLAPRMVEADSLIAAFAHDELPDAQRTLVDRVVRGSRNRMTSGPSEIAFDLDAPITPPPDRIEHRRDAVTERARFQFGERAEGIFLRFDPQ
jgi:CRISPR system Cascade subunit CasD